MTLSLEMLSALVEPLAVAWFAVFLRLGGVMFFLPVFGEALVSMRLKIMLTFVLTILVAPSVATHSEQEILTSELFAGEVLMGIVIGFSVRLTVISLRIAGSIAAQSTSLSQLLGGSAGEPQPGISTVLTMSGLALAASMGLHVHVVGALIETYQTFPIGAVLAGQNAASWAMSAVNAAFSTGFSLGLPFVGAALLYNLALGVINRAMPQMMVAFVGAPAITLGTLALMVLATPSILLIWILEFQGLIAFPFSGQK